MTELTSALRGTGPALVAPILYRLAARMEQVELDEMLEDPAAAAFVLRSAQGLFDVPLVVNHYQLGLEIEAVDGPLERDRLGLPVTGEPRTVELSGAGADTALLRNAVDVAARLSSELRGSAKVAGVLTGPATLAQLRGGSLDGLGELYAVMARRYAEAGVAGILLAEQPGVSAGGMSGPLVELANICRFYSATSIWLAPSVTSLRGPVDVTLGAADVVPAGLLRQRPEGVAATRWTGRTGLVTTDAEVPADTDPEILSAWIDAWRGAALGRQR